MIKLKKGWNDSNKFLMEDLKNEELRRLGISLNEIELKYFINRSNRFKEDFENFGKKI
jgi:hypothetical protein